MNIQKEICGAFCEGLSIRKVPLGYAIRTPFMWVHGEPLVIFGEAKDGLVRMRDSGDSLLILEDLAGDLTTDTKVEAIYELATSHGVLFDEEQALFTGGWVEESMLGEAAIRFMSFLNRLQDLALLSRDRVVSSFREELTVALTDHFLRST
ncbi:MAG: DUF1828 domain-containing protein [Litorimonas sp.]